MKKIDQFYSGANKALLWATRIGTFLMVVTLVLSLVGPALSPVFADGGTGTGDGGTGGTGGTGGGEIGKVTEVFRVLAEMFINVIFTLMAIVFAVGMVRSGFSMQAAQAFGLAGKVSNELANMVGGILVFVIGMLSMQIVRIVVGELYKVIDVSTDLSGLQFPGAQ